MRRSRRAEAHRYLDATFLPEGFSDDLRILKEASGLTWNELADVLGVDPRQLHRWRCGTKPSGDGLYALLQLAAQVPGGVQLIVRRHVLEPMTQESADVGVGFGGVKG
ncbi:MAG: helix-turn-helix transcriptional regulator [Chloroflexota bacterium]|nr:helix-turn-helix transcriptional regulator [Chloroflexota bacterium]MDE2885138.1 helix-turn-helix transcriptional regulator [Chloroflexota bacterium]